MKANQRLSSALQQLVFVGPAFIFFGIIVIVPFVMSMYYSFTEWNGVTSNVKWIGFDNFKHILLEDKDFHRSFWFTTRFTVTEVLLANVVAFGLALLLTQALKTRNMLRTVFFMPNVIGGLLLGFIWQFIFVKGFSNIGELTGLWFFSASLAGRFADRLLGACHRQRLAACRLFDGHLHCGAGERAEGAAGGRVYRRRQSLADIEEHHVPDDHAVHHGLSVPYHLMGVQNVRS